MSSLQTIIEQLEARRAKTDAPYFVPGLWIDSLSTAAVQVNPFAFFHRRLSEIASAPPQPLAQGSGGGEWSQRAVVYNLFPRVTTAFDHNNDGRIALGPNPDGWRETGTLLKCIALLPYIQGMGFNTVHLLPITSIGQDGKKGTLGSPYAIRDPYRLDTNLDEPAAGLNADQLFSGFVEAAHRLGMRVVMEFVLRTAAKDSDWIGEHPDWFYWIRADVPDRAARPRRTGLLRAFGSPIFPPQTLDLIKHKVNAGDFANLPPPPEDYRALYTDPPHPEQVRLEDGRYIGTLDDGTRVRVPGAFTDWPPDDNQPPWSDVTYLRMYTPTDFNYMAYNTLRMYDTAYARPELRNDPLWEALVGVIPHYQRAFGIDGVLIDMGHALPLPLKRRIISSARQINPDFAFWDENFSISHTSCEEGYNAVVGYWLLGLHQAENVQHFVNHMAYHGFPIAFFTAPENHNTPRAASRHNGYAYAHYALALSATLPGIPFILSGFELGETQPINTGLGFSSEQLAAYPPERLPLFSEWALNWTGQANLVKSIQYAFGLRRKHEDLLADNAPGTFVIGYSDNPHILAYSRRRGEHWIGVIANTDQYYEQRGRAVLQSHPLRVPGLWGTFDNPIDMAQEIAVSVTLSPGYVLILDGKDLPR